VRNPSSPAPLSSAGQPISSRPGTKSIGAVYAGRPPSFVIVLLAVTASVTSLWNRFVYDDLALIVNNSRVHGLDAPWRFLLESYWPHGTLYRPLTSLTWALEWQLGGGGPWIYHAVSVAAYSLVCLVVFRLASRLAGRPAGWWAAAVFAVHPVHTEAVATATGQSELWAALIVLLALVQYTGIRRSRELTAKDAMRLGALYLGACLFKEHAVMLPALLAVAEITLRNTPLVEPPSRAWMRLWPALAAVAAGFVITRGVVLGDLAGERTAAAWSGLGPAARIVTMLGVVPEWARLLVFPWHLQADYMPREIPLAHVPGPRQLLGGVMLLSAAWGAWRVRTTQPVLTFAACWAGLTLLPVSNVLVPTGILLAERTLFLPSVGIALAAGVMIARLLRWVTTHPAWRRPVATVLVALLAIAAVRSAIRQLAWRDQATFVAHLQRDAPDSYRMHWIHAHELAKRRDRAGAERELFKALELFDGDPRLLWEVADRYASTGRCAEALPLYRRSLAITTGAPVDHRHYRRCLQTGGGPG
jgi:hypothetical protein